MSYDQTQLRHQQWLASYKASHAPMQSVKLMMNTSDIAILIALHGEFIIAEISMLAS